MEIIFFPDDVYLNKHARQYTIGIIPNALPTKGVVFFANCSRVKIFIFELFSQSIQIPILIRRITNSLLKQSCQMLRIFES